MLHQNFLLQLKRIQRSCFLPLNIISLAVLSLILFFTHINIYAAQVDLAWSPNSESDLAGYKVYYGNTSVSYDSNIDVGNQTSYTIQNLAEGQTYYIVVTAYDTSNNESGYSTEIVYTVPIQNTNNGPVLDPITDITVNEGDAITLSPTATDVDGDTLTFSYSGWMTSSSYTTNFNDSGTHTVTVTVSDGTLTDSQDVTVTVTDVVVNTTVVDLRVNSSNDDAEEGETGSMYNNSSDLELVNDTGNQIVGIRFTSVEIPAGASITKAYVEFETDETGSSVTSLVLSGESSADAAPFTTAAFNISSRELVLSTVTWDNVVAWGTVNEKHKTPDISSIVQDIVDRGSWMSGNAMVFTINGTGKRTAESYDGEPLSAPLLHVEYSILDTNVAPVLDPIADITINEGVAITLSPTATDPDGDALAYTYTGWMTSNSYTTNYTDAGTHTVTITVSDGVLTDSQEVTITVNNVNRAPTLSPINDLTVNEGAIITFNPTATDPDGNALAYTYTGWMILSSYTTNYNDSGTHTVTVTVSDGTLTDSQDVTVTVDDINRPPVLDLISDITVNEGATIILNPTSTDPDEDPLTYTYSDWMTSSSYTTNYTDAGIHTVTVVVSDSTLSDSQDVIITVIEVDIISPSTPTTLQTTVVSSSQIDLSWNTSTDNVEVTGYRIYRDGIEVADVSSTTYQDTGLSPLTTYVYTVSAYDAAGNESSQSTPVSATTQDTVTIFSDLDLYLGNASNWEPLTSSRWGVVSDGGSFRYGINATSYSNLSGDRLGEYSLIQSRTYGDFTFTAKVKTTEDLSTNSSADYAIVFCYQDTNNYYYMMFNSNASFNQLFKIVNGSRQLIANATNLVTLDNAYHDVTLERTGTTVNVYFDNTLTLTATDSSFSNGQVGIGSYDDAPLWDDIVVIDADSILPSTPANLQATVFGKTKMKLSWNASTDNVGVTGYRIYRDGIQVADVSSTTYQDTGLSKNTTYAYTISAYDAVGNESSQSTPLVSNTKSPGRPKGMKVVSS